MVKICILSPDNENEPDIHQEVGPIIPVSTPISCGLMYQMRWEKLTISSIKGCPYTLEYKISFPTCYLVDYVILD